MMDRRMANDLDNYITGHYGEDQFGPEPPEEMYHEACQGEGCEACNDTGLDPVKLAEHVEANRLADEAQYQAYLESEQYREDMENERRDA